MDFIFTALNAFFQLVFYPFRNADPIWGMLWISLLTGIVMLVLFRVTSNQKGIKKSKAKVSAYILEMRLYSHDLGRMLGSLVKTFLANILYLRYMITPILFIIVPVLIVLVHLSYRYEYRPLQKGEHIIVKAVLKPAYPVLDTPVALRASEDIRIEAASLRIPSLNEVDWRLSVQNEGLHALTFDVGNSQYTKSIYVGSMLVPLSSRRIGTNFRQLLLYHAEPELPSDSPLVALEVLYPNNELSFLGFKFHWVIWFFIFSLVFSFAFKNVFNVEL